METYAWHDRLIPNCESDLTEEEQVEEFNRIMSEASPVTTAESFKDFVWTNEPED
jgi:hypothetical protein